jgi:hypothetical protein
MGTQILGTVGPHVYQDVMTLIFEGNAYPIPRLRFGEMHNIRSRSLTHQDVPFADSSWPKERTLKVTFMVRTQRLRSLLVTALNHIYLWEEFFRDYIGRTIWINNPITMRKYYCVLVDMAYSEIDGDHCNMELVFDICNEAELPV